MKHLSSIKLKDKSARHWDRVFTKEPTSPFASMGAGMMVMALGAGFFANVAFTSSQETASNEKVTSPSPITALDTAALDKGAQNARPQTGTKTQTALASATVKPAALKTPPLEAEATKAPEQKIAAPLDQSTPQKTAPQKTADRGFAPRLKPTLNQASAKANAQKAASKIAAANTAPTTKPAAASKPFALGGPFLADEDMRGPSVFFTEDIRADRTPPPPLAISLASDMSAAPLEQEILLQRGETFVDALKRAGVARADRNAAASALGKHLNLRRLRPNQAFTITTTAPHTTVFQQISQDGVNNRRLLALKAKLDSQTKLALSRASLDGAAENWAQNWQEARFEATKEETPLTTRLVAIQGRINGSLSVSATNQGAPQQVVADLANMFAYDIDFQRDIFGGDEFEAIFEVKYDNEGRIVGSGDVLFGRLKWRGGRKEKSYYRFAEAKSDRADYYDGAGQSAKRLLMKTPIDGARLSSGFGTRRHPILGYRKAHKGVDFAAPRGTPIYAAGDGVVERANVFGSFGNYIRIRHANGYKTAYAHLKGFRRGIRAGKSVRQGDIIGYVGTTGRSTGPHLHYEVHHQGKAVNPQRLKIATGKKLAASNLASFQKMRAEIDAMRMPVLPTQERLAKNDSVKDKKEAL